MWQRKSKTWRADKEKTFLRGEVKDLKVLLNAKIQASSLNFKPNTKESLLQENLDTQVQSQFSFQTNSPKGNMIYNQNNFSNEKEFFDSANYQQFNNSSDILSWPKIIYKLHP